MPNAVTLNLDLNMKSKLTEQEQQIINAVADMHANSGAGLNKTQRILRKKFNIIVSQRDIQRRLDGFNTRRDEASNVG